jgi:hypothetical protein
VYVDVYVGGGGSCMHERYKSRRHYLTSRICGELSVQLKAVKS